LKVWDFERGPAVRNAPVWASFFEKSTVIDGVEIAVAMLNLGRDYHPYPAVTPCGATHRTSRRARIRARDVGGDRPSPTSTVLLALRSFPWVLGEGLNVQHAVHV